MISGSGSGPIRVLGRFFVVLLSLLLIRPTSAGPLSERVLLVAPRSRMNKLYICRPDGRDLRRFCKQPGTQTEPALSTTLKRVFYVRQNKRYSEICSADLSGEDFRVELSMRANARNPAPSPDGKRLALSTDLWGAYELAELDLQTGQLHRLTYNQGINTHPQYSPDGERLLFLGRRHGGSQLYLLTLQNKALEQLTDSPFNKGRPSWNPEGTRVVATEALPPKLWSALFELDLSSRKKRFLLPKTRNVSVPSYSVDGTQILFIEQDTLYTFDPADTTAQPFPLRGELYPEDAVWVNFPLP